MLLDNLFTLLGGPGTALVCLGICVFFGTPAAVAVLRASCAWRIPRLERSR